MSNSVFRFISMLLILSSCSWATIGQPARKKNIRQELQKLTDLLTEAERKDDLQSFLKFYEQNAISMPEYQPVLNGVKEIEVFYGEIFARQRIKSIKRTIEETIDLGKTIIEIGTFKKEYSNSVANDSILTHKGKYWNVWAVQPDGNLKLKGEAFGFFHPVENPRTLIVPVSKLQVNDSEVYRNQKVPFELKAYNALMEKGVKTRNGILRAEFFTNDARFMPFADSTRTGIDKLKPYLIAYSSRGEVTIDSISIYTYHHEDFDDYVLEYAKFRVKWIMPQFAGRTEGKSIRVWKRQEDKSLRLYREIGLHNHIE